MSVSLVHSVIRSTCNTCSNMYTPRRFRRVARVLKCHVLLSSGCGRSGQRSGDRGCVCVCRNGLVFHSQKDLRYRDQMAFLFRMFCLMFLFVLPASLGQKNINADYYTKQCIRTFCVPPVFVQLLFVGPLAAARRFSKMHRLYGCFLAPFFCDPRTLFTLR